MISTTANQFRGTFTYQQLLVAAHLLLLMAAEKDGRAEKVQHRHIPLCLADTYGAEQMAR